MVFTDWGALQESPCCHSWGSCGQAFTEEGSHTQEVSSIKLILFMDWLVSHHGGIKIWSCFEPIWFCDMSYDCCSVKQFLNMHFFFQVQPQEDVPPTAQGSCCTEESLLPEAAGWRWRWGRGWRVSLSVEINSLWRAEFFCRGHCSVCLLLNSLSFMHLLVRFPLLFSMCLVVPHVHGVFLLCFMTITIPIPSNTKCKVSAKICCTKVIMFQQVTMGMVLHCSETNPFLFPRLLSLAWG